MFVMMGCGMICRRQYNMIGIIRKQRGFVAEWFCRRQYSMIGIIPKPYYSFR